MKKVRKRKNHFFAWLFNMKKMEAKYENSSSFLWM